MFLSLLQFAYFIACWWFLPIPCILHFIESPLVLIILWNAVSWKYPYAPIIWHFFGFSKSHMKDIPNNQFMVPLFANNPWKDYMCQIYWAVFYCHNKIHEMGASLNKKNYLVCSYGSRSAWCWHWLGPEEDPLSFVTWWVAQWQKPLKGCISHGSQRV